MIRIIRKRKGRVQKQMDSIYSHKKKQRQDTKGMNQKIRTLFLSCVLRSDFL